MKSQRKDGEQTRARLVEVAEEVFARNGYHDAKTADICRLAGANAAAVNYHFGGKEKLYIEAWRHAFEKGVSAYPPDGGIPPSAPAGERLGGRIRALMHRILDPEILEFDIVHREMANPTGLLEEVMRQAIEPLHREFTAIVRELLGGEAPDTLVQLCEMSIHSQCFGPLMHERRIRAAKTNGVKTFRKFPPMDVEVLSAHILRFSLAGMRAVKSTLQG